MAKKKRPGQRSGPSTPAAPPAPVSASPAPVESAVSSPESSPLQQKLIQLKGLHEQGLLTDAELTQQKQALLAAELGTTPPPSTDSSPGEAPERPSSLVERAARIFELNDNTDLPIPGGFYTYPSISSKRVESARKAYAKLEDGETPVALLDMSVTILGRTLMGSGIMVTDRHIWTNFKGPGMMDQPAPKKFAFKDIQSIDIQKKLLNVVFVIDGKPAFVSNQLKAACKDQLLAYFKEATGP